MEFEVLSDHLSNTSEDRAILSISMGEGKTDQIQIDPKSSSDQLASDFCKKHSLGIKAKIILTDEIDKAKGLKTGKEAIQSCLSTWQGSSVGSLTESSMKNHRKIRDLDICLYQKKNFTPEKKPKPAQFDHKKTTFSSLLRPADSKSFLPPSIFNSDQSVKKIQKSPSPGPSPSRSDQLLKTMKKKAYQRLFNSLKPNTSNLISPLSVQDLGPSKELSIISPIIEEMKAMNETLTFEEFQEAMDILMKFLTVTDKNFILQPAKPKTESQPKTKSARFTSPDFYDRCIIKKNESIRRISYEREMKTQLELKECFFQPNISSRRNSCRSLI